MKKNNIFVIILFNFSLLLNAQATTEVTPQLPSTINAKTEATSSFGICEDEYSKVWNLYKAKDYEKSLKLIDKVIKKCGENTAYYEMKCYNLIELKRNKEIIETATKGLALNPQKASLLEIRGNTYYFDFQPQKALADYRQMIKYEKGNARYYNNYLKLLNELRNDTEMISVFSTFLNEKKNITLFDDERFLGEIYFYTSLAFQRQNNTPKAIELLDEALKISPNALSYLNNRAMFLKEIGKYDKALLDINKLIEIDPELSQSYTIRADIYQNKKDFENARKDLLKALALGNGENDTYVELANVYLQLNDFVNAKKYFEVYLSKESNNASAFSNYAYVLYDMKEYQKSLQQFEKSYNINPDEIDTLVGLMVLYQLNGNEEKSIKIKSEIETKTQYKVNQSLLKTLEKEHYFYSQKFKNEWKQLF